MPKDDTQELVTTDQPQIHPLAVQQQQHMKLMELAVQSDGGVEKLEKLMDLQERFERNHARKAFFDAMARFQEQMPVIHKRGKAGFDHRNGGGRTEYSFARLEDIAEAIRKPMADNGLSYSFQQSAEPSGSGPFITVRCVLTHTDGHSEFAEMSAYPDTSGNKNSIQEQASTVSYLRRYTLTGVAGIVVADEDNDGATAVAPPEGYPQEQFEANFPNWKQAIESGKKTAAQIITFLGKKGAHLTEEQTKAINGVTKK